MTILAVYREFGSLRPEVAYLPEGLTLADLRASMSCLPHDFDARGVICINGRRVERSAWRMIRPKPSLHGVPIEVTFHAPPLGGGGGKEGGKNILALVAGIALTALTGFVAGGGLALKLGFSASLFGAGTIGATLAAAGVGLVGSLLISALVPPPTIPTGKTIQNAGPASAEGNVLEPNGPIPRVLGSRKVFPPLACEPLTYFDGGDEVVEAVYVLAGPHQISDIRVGAAPIASLTDVEFETREGWPGDPRITMTRRQGRTEQRNVELRGHTVDANDGVTLESPTGDFTVALPQRMTVATRAAPDEQWLHLVLPAGLNKNASDSNRLRVPVRLRIRQVGAASWIDLPELHFSAATPRQIRTTIKLIWTADATTSPSAAVTEGWVEARVSTPAQTISPASPAWAADAYFDDGAGASYMTTANLGTTRVDHVILNRYTAAFYLDAAIFPRGRYEIEIVRGATVQNSDYSSAGYSVGGSVYDLFGYSGTPATIPQTRNGVSDSLVLVRSVSVWNDHPLPGGDLATIAVRARNRQLEQVSCIAGGYVPDWDGTDWRVWTVTDNPAPHLRDIYAGRQNLDPVPLDVIDNAGLVAWRTACAALNYKVNALIEDASVDDAARIVASCGYAKPYMSEVWGVVRDFDRSAEVPVQIFTPRNSSGFQWTKAFNRVPEGFRVNFRDAAQDYEQRQITVFRPGVSSDTGRLEQLTYEGLVTEAQVTAKALYDQAQSDRRNTFYSLDAPAEAIVCRRGSLVGVQHDSLSAWTGSGRIIDVTINSSGLVTAIRLDNSVPIAGASDMHATTDLHAVADMHALGGKTGVAIRRAGSRTIHAVSNAAGETDLLTFASPISAAGLSEGVLCATGPLGTEVERLIVFAITPKEDLTATLTLVAEAPGIVPLLAA
ncbi:MAG: hypothetical protein V4659_03840 [Pseudomonadota bacterium]